ncbi:MAG: hypothetical protein HKO86_03580 [Gammaproteobacteria bacterium]|nr:hypothetical protein [Gammaproteobacteria bacterium]
MLLAERMGARLEGVFVEDIDLIQVAELPFLREVRLVSRSVEVMNLHRMEQELRVLARRAERLLGEQALRHNVSWSFRVWRGSIDTDLLSADIEADIFALTCLGAGLVRIPKLRAAATAVTVVFSGTDASKRALETAISLAADPDTTLNIILPAGEEAELASMQQQAEMQLGDTPTHTHYIPLHDGELTDLLEILSDTHTSVLVLERDSKLLQMSSLKRGLAVLNCPVLVVR